VIKWFLQREWLSVSIVGTAAVIVFAGIDFLFQGPVALGPAVLIASSLFFSRRWPYIGTALVAAGTIWQLSSVIATNILGILVVWQSTFGASPVLREFGISLTGENATWLTFLLGSTAVVSVNSLSWILGRFLITRDTYVGTPLDRAVITHTQAKLSLDVATAKERLSIVRDLADLLIQRISAVVSLAEGAKFASRSDPESAIRSLDRIESSAQSAQSELRKLYDLLQKGADLSAAPPNIEDLGQLMILMRELGYNATISVDGEPFAINEGAQLCIYRIAFEALENIKKNSAIGADVTVDFYWTAEGLQVLVKDNGIEAARRASVSTAQELASYTVDDDVDALVKPITGATLNALKERASLYEGNIEVTKVPGVGFTLSAMFPHLRAVAGD